MKYLFPPFFTYAQQRIDNLDSKSKEILQNDSLSSLSEVMLIAQQMVEIGEYQEAYQQILAFTERYPFVFFDREGIERARPIVEGLQLDEMSLQRLRKIRSLDYLAGSWRLEDGQMMAEQYPYTYYKPSQEIVKHLQIGNLVKLKFVFDKKDTANPNVPDAEKMWLKITEIDDNHQHFSGTLVNTPFWIMDLYYDDALSFEYKHILDHDMHRHEDNLVDKYSARCMVNKAIIYDNAVIQYLRHDVPVDNSQSNKQPNVQQADKHFDILSDDEVMNAIPDSGWSFYTGDETEAYLQDDDNFVMVSLGAVLRRDDSFIDCLDMGVGHAFVRTDSGFEAVEFGVGDNPLSDEELASFGD